MNECRVSPTLPPPTSGHCGAGETASKKQQARRLGHRIQRRKRLVEVNIVDEEVELTVAAERQGLDIHDGAGRRKADQLVSAGEAGRQQKIVGVAIVVGDAVQHVYDPAVIDVQEEVLDRLAERDRQWIEQVRRRASAKARRAVD